MLRFFSYLWVMVCYITSIYRYYTTEFNWNFNVVTMKQKEPLSKFDKWWMGKPMCIEGTYVRLTHWVPLKFRINFFIQILLIWIIIWVVGSPTEVSSQYVHCYCFYQCVLTSAVRMYILDRFMDALNYHCRDRKWKSIVSASYHHPRRFSGFKATKSIFWLLQHFSCICFSL